MYAIDATVVPSSTRFEGIGIKGIYREKYTYDFVINHWRVWFRLDIETCLTYFIYVE